MTEEQTTVEETKKPKVPAMRGTVEIKFENLRAFVCAIEAISCECRIHFLNKLMTAKCVDPSNVAYVSASTEVDFTGGSPVVIGLDMDVIKNVIKSMETLGVPSDAVVTIVLLGNEESPVLRISQKGRKSHVFEINGCSQNTLRKDPTVNEKALTARQSADLGGADLVSAISVCSAFSDRCRFLIKGGKFYISAKEDTQQCKIDMNATFVDEKDHVASMFSIDYVKDIAHVFRKSTVHINLGTDVPVTFTGSVSKVAVKFMLAPRVESESAMSMEGWL
jgi:hypothetical protein